MKIDQCKVQLPMEREKRESERERDGEIFRIAVIYIKYKFANSTQPQKPHFNTTDSNPAVEKL